MIEKIVDLSIKHWIAVILVTLLACAAGTAAFFKTPVDALPDLSETQVIIAAEWDRDPAQIESQVTFPIVSALTGGPSVRTVRAITDYGSAFIYIIFDEGTPNEKARSWATERLTSIMSILPPGASARLGADTTSLGWIYQYALIDNSGTTDSSALRTLQDSYVRYKLRTARGVSEVASVGGFVREYQVNVDPFRLRASKLDIRAVADAAHGSNLEVGAHLLTIGDSEYMIRGRGYVKTLDDLSATVVSTSASGSPITVADLGEVNFGPEARRGSMDLDGRGDVVGGIVEMRTGSDVSETLKHLRDVITAMQPTLPQGVSIQPFYDRSDLIQAAYRQLRSALGEELLIVSAVIWLFLRRASSALIPILTLPAALMLAFLPIRWMGESANVMSLCGLAIALGALVDASIVVVEQTHQRLKALPPQSSQQESRTALTQAVKQVARPSFFALVIIGLSFLPITALPGEQGRLFRPLAYTKSLAMFAGATLAVTFDPALRILMLRFQQRWHRKRIRSTNERAESQLQQALISIYEPILEWTLQYRQFVISAAVAAIFVTIPAALRLDTELMPALEEGTLLYMPSLPIGISTVSANHFLQRSDTILKSFPEVDHVLGKMGRANTATDPAAPSMLETLITLNRSHNGDTALPGIHRGLPKYLNQSCVVPHPTASAPKI